MIRNLAVLMLIVFSLSACNDPKSSVSSTKTAKLLDPALAIEIQKMREESSQELHQFESRMGELIMTMNESMFGEMPDVKAKYNDVLAAQMQMLQTKSHFDMERMMFVDKMMNQIATANSKDEVKKNSESLINELRQQSEIYIQSYRNLLDAMHNAGIESPLIDEMMMPENGEEPQDGSVDGGVEGEVAPPVGEPVH